MKSLHRLSLITVIVAFSIAALLGIGALLLNEFGDTQVKILLTTVVVGLEAAAVLCYATPRTRGFVELGTTGFVVSLLPFLLALTFIWYEPAIVELTQNLLMTSAVVAATLAQISLIGGLTGGTSNKVRWIVRATILVAVVIALMLCWTILSESFIGDWFWRIFGVFGILDALGTVVLTALGLVNSRSQKQESKLEAAPELSAQEPVGAAPEKVAEDRIVVGDALKGRLVVAAAARGTSVEQLLEEAVDAYLRAQDPVETVRAPEPAVPAGPETSSGDDVGDGQA